MIDPNFFNHNGFICWRLSTIRPQQHMCVCDKNQFLKLRCKLHCYQFLVHLHQSKWSSISKNEGAQLHIWWKKCWLKIIVVWLKRMSDYVFQPGSLQSQQFQTLAPLSGLLISSIVHMTIHFQQKKIELHLFDFKKFISKKKAWLLQ